MNFTDNRLQFIHCETLFETSQAAKDYVLRQAQLERPALYAEPLILKYGDAVNPNIILAVGSVGNGTASLENKVFFIDVKSIEESLNAIEKEEEASQEELTAIKSLIIRIMKACGVNETGNYEVDLNDALLKNATSLKSADTILSQALQDEIKRATDAEDKLNKAHTLETVDTDSVKFELEKSEDGMKLKGMVKVATDYAVENKIYPNSLIKTDKGLFVHVDLEYKEQDARLVLNSNGVEKEIQLPKETHLVSGEYDYKNEALVLKLNRKINETVENSDTIVVDLKKLIGEWTVLGVESKTPIILSKEACQFEDELHGAEKYQDILKADVRIIDEIIPEIKDNILKRSEDGRALYVKGTADNITYWKNGEKLTVKEALDNIKCVVSQHENNIIVEKTDGIYAKADLQYNTGNNTLIFDNGKETRTFKLNSGSVIYNAYYDSANESLVIEFKLADGSIDKVVIPLSEIFTEWAVDNTNHTVTLTKTPHQTQGKDSLSADVNISPLNDNILTNSGHALYVKGTADNIKYGDASNVATEIAKIEGTSDVAGSIRNIVKAETDARVAADEGLSTKINDLSTKVDNEITRSTETDIQHKNAIDNEVQRATTEETVIKEKLDKVESDLSKAGDAISGNTTAIATLTTNVEDHLKVSDEKHKELSNSINVLVENVSGNATSIAELAKDVENHLKVSDKKHEELSDSVTTLEGKVSTVETNLEGINTKLDGHISTSDVKHTELSNSVYDLIEKVSGNTNAISRVKTDLTSEISRATGREDALEKLITDHEHDTDGMSADIEKLKDDVQTLNTDLATARTAIEANTTLATEAKQKAENALTEVDDEKKRAIQEEGTISESLTLETERAKGVENVLNLRLKAVESTSQANESNIASEIARAKEAESVNKKLIDENKILFDKEVERSTQKDSEHDKKLTDNENAINSENSERKAEDDKLKELIEKVAKEDSFVVNNSGTVTLEKVQSETGSTLTAKVVVSDEDTNIINKDGNALKASVDLTYDSGRNVLTFTTSNHAPKEIALSAGSIIDGIDYNEDTHKLIIRYHTESSSEAKTTEVDVSALFNEISVVDRGDKVILINLDRQDDGTKLISADLMLDSSEDNLAAKHNGVLFVSRKADAHYVNDGRTVQKYLDDLGSVISKEISDREKAIKGINERVDDIEKTVNNYEERFVAIETKNINQDTLIGQLQDADKDIIGDVDTLQADVNQMKSTVADHETRINTLETNIRVNNGRLDRIDTEIGNIRQDITNLNQKTDIETVNTSTAILNWNCENYHTTMSVDVKVSENAENLIVIKQFENEDGLCFDGSIDYGTY